jgi:hypothetical protein
VIPDPHPGFFKIKKEKITIKVFKKNAFFSELCTGKLQEEPLAIQRALQSMEVRKKFPFPHMFPLLIRYETGMKKLNITAIGTGTWPEAW